MLSMAVGNDSSTDLPLKPTEGTDNFRFNTAKLLLNSDILYIYNKDASSFNAAFRNAVHASCG